MPITRYGVYHNLKESKFTTSRCGVVFFFSSELYRDKFLDTYKSNRKAYERHLQKKIDGRFLNLTWLADIHLYKMIEKRGFRVTINGVEQEWKELCRFASWNVTSKNIEGYEKMQEQNLED